MRQGARCPVVSTASRAASHGWTARRGPSFHYWPMNVTVNLLNQSLAVPDWPSSRQALGGLFELVYDGLGRDVYVHVAIRISSCLHMSATSHTRNDLWGQEWSAVPMALSRELLVE